MEGFTEPIRAIRWLHNNEKLEFVQDPESVSLTVECTGYAYGIDLVVRVAQIEV